MRTISGVVLAASLFSCGPMNDPAPPGPIQATARIRNNYSDCIFNLTATNAAGVQTMLFDHQRVNGSRSETSKGFEVADGEAVTFGLAGQCLGSWSTVEGMKPPGGPHGYARVAEFTWDYDLATAGFIAKNLWTSN